MFNVQVPATLILDRAVTPAAKELYALVAFRQANGRIPTQAEMASDLGVNAAIIRRRLEELCKAGWVSGREKGTRGRYLLEAEPLGRDREKPSPPPVPLSEQHRAMLVVIAEVCSIDLRLASRAVQGQANQVARFLREGGFLPEDVIKFGRWWRGVDWRGRAGSPPALAQMRSEWRKALDWLDVDQALPEFK